MTAAMRNTSPAQDALPGVNAPLRHPGPAAEARVQAVATTLREIEITCDGEASLEAAVIAAFDGAGLKGGFVEIENLACSCIDYVVPALSEFPDRLAWYSAPRSPQGPARIRQGYMSVGRDGEAGFVHCHGIWMLANGRRALGHLLGGQTVPEAGQTLRAWGFETAVFDRQPDAETNFSLFGAVGEDAARPTALAVTLRPNEDIPASCMALCEQMGWDGATVIGLGSLNGAGFAGDSIMQDHVSEFLVRRGYVSPTHADIDIAVVDSSANVFEGILAPGQGRVSITSELVLLARPLED